MWDKKRSLKERYDFTSDVYDNRYEDIQRRKVHAVLDEINEANRVLDVGCGTGLFLDEISGRVGKTVGVDFSSEMIKKAKRRAGDVLLVLADADNLPFRDDCFDTVVSLTLLQNMPDPERTISEMSRVTESEGKIIVTALKKKLSEDEIEAWMSKADVVPMKSRGLPESEDFLTVGRRS